MEYENAQNIIYNLGCKASHLLHNNFMVCTPLYRKNSLLPDVVQMAIVQLMSSIHTTSESALLLIGNGRLWDNELLIRSIVEGTVKYMYISEGSLDTRKQKAEEYLYIIPEMELIRTHYKAKSLLNKICDNSKKWKPIQDVLLSQTELNLLNKKYSRDYRNELKHKWSFSEIVRELSNSIEFDTLISLHYGYNLGSHLIHQDGNGINFKQERIKQNIEGNYSVDIAHASSQLSNILALSLIRSNLYCKIQQIDPVILKESIKLINDFIIELGNHFDNWIVGEYSK